MPGSHVTTSLDIPTLITEVDTLISLTGATPTGSQITGPQDQIGESNQLEIFSAILHLAGINISHITSTEMIITADTKASRNLEDKFQNLRYLL